jgi:hypothetical protein
MRQDISPSQYVNFGNLGTCLDLTKSCNATVRTLVQFGSGFTFQGEHVAEDNPILDSDSSWWCNVSSIHSLPGPNRSPFSLVIVTCSANTIIPTTKHQVYNPRFSRERSLLSLS